MSSRGGHGQSGGGSRSLDRNHNSQGCDYCGKYWDAKKAKPLRLQRCTGCKCAWYCSKNDQKKHWKSHKQACKRLAERYRQSEIAAKFKGPLDYTQYLLLLVHIRNLANQSSTDTPAGSFATLTLARKFIERITSWSGLGEAIGEMPCDMSKVGFEDPTRAESNFVPTDIPPWEAANLLHSCLRQHMLSGEPTDQSIVECKRSAQIFRAFVDAATTNEDFEELIPEKLLPELEGLALYHEAEVHFEAKRLDECIDVSHRLLERQIYPMAQCATVLGNMIVCLSLKVDYQHKDIGEAFIEYVMQCIIPWLPSEVNSNTNFDGYLVDLQVLVEEVRALIDKEATMITPTNSPTKRPRLASGTHPNNTPVVEELAEFESQVKMIINSAIRNEYKEMETFVEDDLFEKFSQSAGMLCAYYLRAMAVGTPGDGELAERVVSLHNCDPPCANKLLAVPMTDSRSEYGSAEDMFSQYESAGKCICPDLEAWADFRMDVAVGYFPVPPGHAAPSDSDVESSNDDVDSADIDVDYSEYEMDSSKKDSDMHGEKSGASDTGTPMDI